MISEAHRCRIVARNAPTMAEGGGALIELRLHRRREREHHCLPIFNVIANRKVLRRFSMSQAMLNGFASRFFGG
ncbi:hypothetical protein [Methylocystis sp. H4A]|uniref:hypothetical protein n=1 Tax=Methylocystis sp. H4A TaxID=2785788 RepID=UPI001FEF0311|nr:hypothetical protein [Methylocystis sp. H4A]